MQYIKYVSFALNQRMFTLLVFVSRFIAIPLITSLYYTNAHIFIIQNAQSEFRSLASLYFHY